MMRVKILCLSLIFFCWTTFAVAQSNNQTPFGTAAPDLYWLTYIESGKGVFLMQIDSTGKVIRAPVFMDAGPAISRNGANKINLWGSQRVVIDKKTLRIVKKVKNTITGSLESVTNKTQNNFAAVLREEQEDLTLSFFGVSPTGVPNGAKWDIASSQAKTACDYVRCPPGVVSSDGKAIFWIIRGFIFTSPGLYIQPLLDTGRPDGFERLVTQDVDPTDGAISNVLPGGKIYLVYLLGDGLPRQLFLQAVDAQIGQRIGDKILLKNARFGYRSVAIDPLGRFVIYAHQNQQNVHFLSFLALDATGHSSGTSKVLVGKVNAREIHLLKD